MTERQPASREMRTAKAVRDDAMKYLHAHYVLTELREMYRKRRITAKEYKSLREHAIAGDIDGAVKNLAKIMAGEGLE